jgi:hypothetical protein
METFSPTSRFTSVLFPTFGLPTTATNPLRNPFSEGISDTTGLEGESLIRARRSFPVFVSGGDGDLREAFAFEDELEFLDAVPPERETVEFGLREFSVAPLLVF